MNRVSIAVFSLSFALVGPMAMSQNRPSAEKKEATTKSTHAGMVAGEGKGKSAMEPKRPTKEKVKTGGGERKKAVSHTPEGVGETKPHHTPEGTGESKPPHTPEGVGETKPPR
jgi:hypothetical protein